MFELSGKNAIVTGGSRGIGRAAALALGRQGANVCINYRVDQSDANEIVNELISMGMQAFAYEADVSNKSQVERMFATVKEHWGRLDILVNNAGVLEYSEVGKLTEDQWDRIVNTNLKGEFLCAQEAVKQMKEVKWGRIINIASVIPSSLGGKENEIAHYSASKGGIIGLTKSLAIEVAKFGITVNAVAPGLIETNMASKLTGNEEMKDYLLLRIPKGRFGKPEDVASAVAFLASDEADYLTGVVLNVDGGWR